MRTSFTAPPARQARSDLAGKWGPDLSHDRPLTAWVRRHDRRFSAAMFAAAALAALAFGLPLVAR